MICTVSEKVDIIEQCKQTNFCFKLGRTAIDTYKISECASKFSNEMTSTCNAEQPGFPSKSKSDETVMTQTRDLAYKNRLANYL